MTQEDRFEEFVRAAIEDVPAVPRDEMWAHIEQARRFRRPRDSRRQWLAWGVALAAMLVIGIALGRVSMSRQTPAMQEQVAQTDAARSPVADTQPLNRSAAQPRVAPAGPLGNRAPNAPTNAAYTLAALEHLGRVEVLLTAVSSGSVDQQLVGWAKDMLTSTQLLLDSPAANDPRMAHLLQDLELLLAQIAASTSEQRTQADLDLIHHGIKETDVLPRLRATAAASNRTRPVGT
jgi:hypothetical protein